MSQNPEIASSIRTGGFNSNVHDVGTARQPPVLMIHGSGPGVSAWANWRQAIPALAREPPGDRAGHGGLRLHRPSGRHRVQHGHLGPAGARLLDALGLEQVDLVGNSFGGALAHGPGDPRPERVQRLVLMGSVGVPFPITEGLDAVWGYQASFENMRSIMDYFAWSRELVTDELAKLRYEASIRPGFQESFSAMFPAPRQRWVDAMTSAEADIRALPHETLIIHGREDKVIPLSNSLTLADWIPNAQLHVFGHCGHWTQIEHSARFNRLVGDFLAEADLAILT
jgi:2-hydroxymuconate-semialdehyde hydrolase